MNINRLETPALVLDVNIMTENMEAMKRILDGTSLALRPHYKSHKCASIAKWQIKNGAKGMTCAKISEARDLADCGIEDILIANQITDKRKLSALANLAGDCCLTVCVDDAENVLAIAKEAKNAGTTVHCLVEYDIGMERCGVKTVPEVIRLAELIGSQSNLVFAGIQAYAGHLSHTVDASERSIKTAENYAKLRTLLDELTSHGMPAATVSGGSTGTAEIKAREGLYTELQAGSYLFMDSTYRDLNLPFKNSLFVLSTVVSRRDGLTVVDAGVKTCGVDQGMPSLCDGNVREIVASEEHFQLHGYTEEHQLGDRIMLVPGHCCSTVNLHDKIYLIDGEKVIDRIPVTARGIGR